MQWGDWRSKMGGIVVQAQGGIGGLNVVKLCFGKYSAVTLVTTHIFSFPTFKAGHISRYAKRIKKISLIFRL